MCSDNENAESSEPDLTIIIDGEKWEIDETYHNGFGGTILRCGKREFVVFESECAAGQAAKSYWRDMAENDPQEFACIVGEQTLISWALGQSAGPGNFHVRSLEEWLDLCSKYPEEQWASCDGTQRDVDKVSEELVEELGFRPTVAYRHN